MAPRPPRVIGSGTLDNNRWFEIYRRSLLIGMTNLEVVIEPGARAAGLFHPTPAFTSVRQVFALYQQALEDDDSSLLRHYVRKRDELQLRVQRAGNPIDATVELISTWTAAIHIVHISSRDNRLWF